MANQETEPVEENLTNTEEGQENTAAPNAIQEETPQLSTEEKLKAEVAELTEKYLRLYSDFDNMKRRNAKERIELMQTAGKDVLLSLLPIIDDFERALKSMDATEDIVAAKEGVALIHNKFFNILSQKGLKSVDSVGKEFDSDFHEAITNIPAPTEEMKGKVIEEIEKGYTLHDKVIRFAKVVVGE